MSVGNTSRLRRRSPPGWPSVPDVICHTQTPAALGANATAAMTPRPETNLLICHGVLAPRARWRSRVVVYGWPVPEPTASTAPLAADPDGTGVKTASLRAWSWAALMHRAFGIDVLACAHCGGRLRLIATLHDPAVIRKILAHLALGHSGQSPGPAPPESGAAASSTDRLGAQRTPSCWRREVAFVPIRRPIDGGGLSGPAVAYSGRIAGPREGR